MAANGRFFKVLMPEFSDKLSLPPEFTKNITTDMYQTATLRSLLGEWQVKIQGDVENLYFGEGWQEFTQAHDFSVGFFLLFKHKGNMVFSIKVLDLSMCETVYDFARYHKEIPQLNMEYSGEDTTRNDEQETLGKKRFCSLRPSFKVTMKPINISKKYLHVPHEFKTACNISGKDQLLLRDPKGRQWPVKLCHRQVNSYHRTQFGHGWKEFCLNHNLEEGNICIFKLASGNNTDVVDVNIFRKCGKQG